MPMPGPPPRYQSVSSAVSACLAAISLPDGTVAPGHELVVYVTTDGQVLLTAYDENRGIQAGLRLPAGTKIV